MNVYICILRGINVSGQKLIKMEALRKMCDDLGLENAVTYIQSGNIIFTAKKIEPAKIEKEVSVKILEVFGFDVPVIVRELGELREVLNNNPYLNQRKEDAGRLYVTFLAVEPEKVNIEKLQSFNFPPEELTVYGKDIYLFFPDGYGNAKINNNFIENKLKVTATTRNWKTVNELVKIGKSLMGKK